MSIKLAVVCSHLKNLDDRSDKLFQEAVIKQGGPVGVNEIDEQTFDVRAVLVLIGHDHHLAVAKRAYRVGRLIIVPRQYKREMQQSGCITA